MMRTQLLITVALLLFGAENAASQQHGERSAHAGKEVREIKALSADEMAALLAGDGMGLALAAELNAYPGPRHVLDAAAELRLAQRQTDEVRAIFDSMQRTAVGLGRQIVHAEARLDSLFAGRRADAATLREILTEIARLQGDLRYVHLRAHLETTAVLTPEQIRHYNTIRGYHGTAGHH